MLKDTIAKYTVSTEDAEEDIKLDEATDDTTDVVENTDDDEALKGTEDETATDDVVETEETQSDTTVLEAPTDEQGEISTADSEEVVAEVKGDEVESTTSDAIGEVEAGDDAFKGTDDQADITEGSDTGAAAPTDTAAEDAAIIENTLAEGAEVKAGQDEIIAQAQSTAAEIEGGGATDVNGNPITEDEAAVNTEEEQIEAEVEAENAEAVETTEVTGEETPLEEAEALADELADDVTENAGESADDSLGESGDAGGDTGDAFGGDASGDMPTDSGDASTDFADDDTPLEGAEETSESTGTDTDVAEGEETTDAETVEDETSDTTEESTDTDFVDEPTSGETETTAIADDDDTPLDVDVEDSFKDTEVDGTPDTGTRGQDDSAATVEETIDDKGGVEEELASEIADDAATDTTEMEAAVSEAEEEPEVVVEETTEEETEEVVEEEVEEESTGEIEETDEPADIDEGELDIPDVDMDITDDEVAEAENEAEEEEIVADKDEKEAIDASRTIEELQAEAKGLEGYIVFLEQGIATEKYDALFVAKAHVELTRQKELWGDHAPDIPALEDYTANDLDLIYKASLESFRGAFSRTVQLSTRLRDNLNKWWNRPMVTKIVSRSSAINKAVDKALVNLKESDFNGGDVSGVAGYLSTSSTGLVKAVADDLKYTTGVATKGLKGNEKLVGDIVAMLDDIISAKTPEQIPQVLKQVANLKSVKSAYPSEVFTAGKLMGNWVLEFKDGSIGLSGIPVAVKEANGDRKTSFNLTKADLSNLLVMAKTYAALATKVAETSGTKIVEEIPSITHQRARALPMNDVGRVQGKWDEEKGVDALAEDMAKAHKAHHDLYKFIVKHALDMAEALIAVVNKAI